MPFIATVEGEISFKESYEHSWGGSTTTSTSVTTSTTVTVPARTTIKVTVLIYNSRLNIPFTYTVRFSHDFCARVSLMDGVCILGEDHPL